MDVFFTDCQQGWSQHKQQIRSDILMEAKQEAQLVAQVRWRNGKHGEQRKIKGVETEGQERWIQRQVEYMRNSFKGLMNGAYNVLDYCLLFQGNDILHSTAEGCLVQSPTDQLSLSSWGQMAFALGCLEIVGEKERSITHYFFCTDLHGEYLNGWSENMITLWQNLWFP